MPKSILITHLMVTQLFFSEKIDVFPLYGAVFRVGV